jgi:hypothetical protein
VVFEKIDCSFLAGCEPEFATTFQEVVLQRRDVLRRATDEKNRNSRIVHDASLAAVSMDPGKLPARSELMAANILDAAWWGKVSWIYKIYREAI